MDLFSGIGGFSLGLKRASGFRTVAYCEIDGYCQRVLLSRMHDGHLDSAPICTDVRALDGGPWNGTVDLICGGFPCQDISDAGLRRGLDGERSGLWSEIARLVRQVRPKYLVVENVAALLHRGMGRVLGDLADCGLDAEWRVLPACGFGAPHCRERVWIVAHPHSKRLLRWTGNPSSEWEGVVEVQRRTQQLEGLLQAQVRSGVPARSGRGVHDGVPKRVDRLCSLGNSIVPVVAEWIGRRILEAS
jgi:DNA (cytosine-5)-methyltransferase 1